jgi:hypothetical protein
VSLHIGNADSIFDDIGRRAEVRMRRVIVCSGAVAMTLIAACQPERMSLSSRHASFGGATLITVFRPDSRAARDTALAHVLFVPVDMAPKPAGFTGGSSSGGTADVRELKFWYSDLEGSVSIRSHPVTILKEEAVSAGSTSFSLGRGNLFTATVGRDGTVELKQILRTIDDPETSAESILTLMKAEMPDDRRVQLLSPR